jgi:hypothetical protein
MQPCQVNIRKNPQQILQLITLPPPPSHGVYWSPVYVTAWVAVLQNRVSRHCVYFKESAVNRFVIVVLLTVGNIN